MVQLPRLCVHIPAPPLSNSSPPPSRSRCKHIHNTELAEARQVHFDLSIQIDPLMVPACNYVKCLRTTDEAGFLVFFSALKRSDVITET